jgi:RNA polymerase sigma-70 factor (ECF subfamily)
MSNELSVRDQFEACLTPILAGAFATAMRLTGQRADAEDLLQDATIRAFNSFHQFQRDTNFKAWFSRVLVTTFLNIKRKHLASPQIAQLPDDEDIEDLYLFLRAEKAGLASQKNDPAQRLMQHVERDEIGAALAALPEDFRVVVVLSLVQEMPYEDIARVLDCPIGTVRSRLHRGRKLLQKSLWNLALEKGIVKKNDE